MTAKDDSMWIRFFSSMAILFCFALGSGESWFGVQAVFILLIPLFILGCLLVLLSRRVMGFGLPSDIIAFGLVAGLLYLFNFRLSFGPYLERDYGTLRINAGTLRGNENLLVDDGTVTKAGYYWAAILVIPVLSACWVTMWKSRAVGAVRR